MMRESLPRIKGLKLRTVLVPMTEPHQTASGVVSESPLVLTDVITDAGISGHSIIFTYTPAALKPTAELTLTLHKFWLFFETKIKLPSGVYQGNATNRCEQLRWHS